MGDLDGAIQAYEHALRHNWRSVAAMHAISSILRTKEHFHKAIEYLQNILKIDGTNGEVWGSLGAWAVSTLALGPTAAGLTPRSRTLLSHDG